MRFWRPSLRVRAMGVRAIAHQSSGVALAESIGGSSSRNATVGSSPLELSTIQSR